jgi:ketosteroid isomerase-like protein
MIQFLVLAVTVAILAVNPVTTAAQGSSAEEAAVKDVVQTTVRAVNKDELTTMLAQFADDAVIDSRAAGGKVSKAKYAEVMADVFKKGDLISAELRDVNVTMADPTHATVVGTVYLQTRTNRLSGRNEWKLEKRDGRWLIVETTRK